MVSVSRQGGGLPHRGHYCKSIPRCLELCIKVMRKRLQRVGGTQNGKSELDGPSYAEFYQEHDGNLTLDVWWPNHE